MVAKKGIKRQKEKQEEKKREVRTAKNIDDSHKHKLNKEEKIYIKKKDVTQPEIFTSMSNRCK